MPRITIESYVDVNTKEVEELVSGAILKGLRDTIVAIHNDVVQLSPWKTAHNRRSIASEVSRMGTVIQGSEAEPEKVVDDSLDEAACYSTSGYGGYIEVGTAPHVITVKNAKVLTDGKNFFGKTVNHPGTNPYPYFRPAFDMHKDELVENIKKHMEVK